MAITVGIAVFPGVEELDFVGPWEVLRTWQQWWPADEIEVFTVARDDGILECAKGMRVIPACTWSDSPRIDVLVYPGGMGTRAQLGDTVVTGWLQKLAAEGTVTSVCTGSLVFADAGLLDGRPATTHWASLEQLASLGKGVNVRADARYVDTGDVVTASGVSAGIDMALHLVSRFAGEGRPRGSPLHPIRSSSASLGVPAHWLCQGGARPVAIPCQPQLLPDRAFDWLSFFPGTPL